MSMFAKLTGLRAVRTNAASGADELSIGRADGFQFEWMSMSSGDVVELDRLLPFDDQLELILREIDPQTDDEHSLGVHPLRGSGSRRTHRTVLRGRCALRPDLHRYLTSSGAR